MFAAPTNAPLIQDREIDQWVQSLFGSTRVPEAEGVKLVVKIDGRAVGDPAGDAAAARAAVQEMMQSLAMYGSGPALGDTEVRAPPADTIRRALEVLANGVARRKMLGAALSIFGRRVVAPFERVLSAADASPSTRLAGWRQRVMAGLADIGLTLETTRIVENDLRALLTDEYLEMLGDNEAQNLRPRLEELAARVLEVLAVTFHRALDRFGAHTAHVADRVVRGLPPAMALRDAASLLRRGFVIAVAEFLEVETSAELAGALRTLSGQYGDLVPAERPLVFEPEWYGDLAAECWNVVALYG